MMKEMLEKLKIALFPKRCELCGSVICIGEVRCEACECLEHINAPICLKCGCAKEDCICKKQSREAEYKGVIAPFYYGGSIASGILNLKMNEMPKLAQAHGREIANAVKKHYGDIDFDFVTFVPMYKRDEAARGFNQARLLAEIVSEECGIPLRDVLVKTHKTKMQKRQNATDRFVNMYGAFEIRENENLSGAKVLLIDDVKTTGSTLTSVALTLKAYGAKSVYCAVTAIVK